MIKLSSNRRSILIAAVAGAAIALIMARNPLAATADTVYDIVNYPAEQDGWILPARSRQMARLDPSHSRMSIVGTGR